MCRACRAACAVEMFFVFAYLETRWQALLVVGLLFSPVEARLLLEDFLICRSKFCGRSTQCSCVSEAFLPTRLGPGSVCRFVWSGAKIALLGRTYIVLNLKKVQPPRKKSQNTKEVMAWTD